MNHKIAINREPMRHKLREEDGQAKREAGRSFAIAFVIYTLPVNMRLKLKDNDPFGSPLSTQDTHLLSSSFSFFSFFFFFFYGHLCAVIFLPCTNDYDYACIGPADAAGYLYVNSN